MCIFYLFSIYLLIIYFLAPTECLQYFTAATGRVKSFNWQDVATKTTRQLNNQKYNICFRTELVSASVRISFKNS